ncbi:M48 family metallopeptidase [Crocosphaera sp. XPORK-15E]|uniref:M48 family metallopeptidase n=1 Tax=Crocosphaera sp. XPORK-15E TaxID=3110247 RepID=UPI002B202B6B|nr:M48 family metallopeptidase [Crocosphaera sp. XPORK-15E]MEA5534093.1 M48 family metallopeptidase [Crocosphaera sp. XPORK-15E]
MPSYPGLSSEAFRHPLDKQAEQTLRSVPGFDLVATSFMEYLYERPQQISLMGNSIKVGPRQYSTLYGIFRETVHDLDISPEPLIYVSQNPVANAYSLGKQQPYIVLNAGLLDLSDEIELRTVVAHELGHIKCEHSVLIQMAIWAMGAASLLGELTLGLGNIITTGLIFAFYEWRRKAELSADRAALLVIDDPEPIFRMMMKMAGGSHKYAHECHLDEFLKQAEKYRELDEDDLNQLYKFLIYNGGNGVFLSHPFPVDRVHYLQNWATSREYQDIRQGNYKRSEKSGSVNVDTNSEADNLRRQIEQLQQEIENLKSQDNQT